MIMDYIKARLTVSHVIKTLLSSILCKEGWELMMMLNRAAVALDGR